MSVFAENHEGQIAQGVFWPFLFELKGGAQ